MSMFTSIRSSLGGKLIIVALMCLLPSAFIGGALLQSSIENILQAQVDHSIRRVLNYTQFYMDRELHHVESNANIIASDPALRRAFDTQNSLGLNSQLNRIAAIYPEVNYMMLIDEYHEVFAINTVGENNRKIPSESKLGARLEQHPLYVAFDKSKSHYGAPGSDPFLAHLGMKEGVAQWFVAPVFVGGKALGWVVISFKWESAMRQIHERLIQQLAVGGLRVLGRGIIADASGRILVGQRSMELDNILEVNESFTVAGRELTLFIQFDRSLALSPMSELRGVFVGVVVPFGLFLLMAIYFIVSRFVLKPIARLDKGVETFAAGELSYRLPVDGVDELSRLSAQFNQMGERVERSKKYLEQEVEKRTRDLSLSVKEAEAANAAKSDFLASMSHEIRTPMNGVLGMLGLLLRSPLAEKQSRYAKVAQSSAESLLNLINDILDFSKMEAGKVELEELEFDICNYLGEFIEAASLKAHEKGVEVILDVTRVSKEMVVGDPTRLRQILTNLVGNAIKFTDQGEIVVSVDIDFIDAEKILLMCSVSDTGIGIPKEEISSLFGKFTQVDTSTTRKYGGTGLGLAVSDQLCRIMGGDGIKVKSELGKGSVFSFGVLIKKSDRHSIVLPDVDISGASILIVDDNETNLMVLKHQLELWDADVVVAQGATEALNILRLDTFDVAILDMQMPFMDGETLGKRIREQPKYDTMRLVMMTSIGDSGDSARYANMGFDAYFAKPVTIADLHAALTVVVDNGEALSQATPILTAHHVRGIKKDWVGGGRLFGARILVVEDNLVNQEIASDLLLDLGVSVEIASNGKKCLDALQAAPEDCSYDLILMDCQMPEMDGYMASSCIRDGLAGEGYKRIPIIALTANAMMGDKEKCLNSGMNDFLTKPVNFIELEQLLIKWLSSFDRAAGQKSEESTPPKVELEDLPVWDYDALLERVRGRPERISKMVSLFLSGREHDFQTLKDAVRAQNRDSISYQIHGFKGSCSNLAAFRLTQAALDIEHCLQEGDLEALGKHWPSFEAEYSAVIKVFKQFLQKQDHKAG